MSEEYTKEDHLAALRMRSLYYAFKNRKERASFVSTEELSPGLLNLGLSMLATLTRISALAAVMNLGLGMTVALTRQTNLAASMNLGVSLTIADLQHSPPTSYDNAGARGNRTNWSPQFPITTTDVAGTGTITLIVNGDTGTNGFTFNNGINSGFVKFDFGSPHYLTDFKVYASNTNNNGVWNWESSPDNSAWTTRGGTFTLAGGTSGVEINQPGNTGVAARYWRMVLTGGAGTVNTVALREFEFKLVDDGTVLDRVYTDNTSGTKTVLIPRYATAQIELWGGGAAANECNTVGTGRTAGSNGNASSIASLSLTANGGNGAGTNTNTAGTGGSASGGDTNTTGNSGTNGSNGVGGPVGTLSGAGGAGPNGGGAGGTGVSAGESQSISGNSGTAPGGGGSGDAIDAPMSGSWARGAGGGSGGKCLKTYTGGSGLAFQTDLSYTIGAAVSGPANGTFAGVSGGGAAGGIKITIAD